MFRVLLALLFAAGFCPAPVLAQTCGTLPSTYPVTAGSNGPLNVGAGSLVNGTTITGTGNSIQMSAVRTSTTPSFPALSPSTYPSFSSSTNTAASTIAAGTYNTVTAGTTTSFSGGTYYIATLNAAGANAALKFGAGTYYITNASLSGSGVTITVTGAVTIYLGSGFTTGSSPVINSGGTVANFRLFLYPNANLSFGNNGTMSGVIYGPGSGNNVTTGTNFQLQGMIAVNSNVVLSGSDQVTLSTANQTALSAVSTCPAPLAQWHLDQSAWAGTAGEVTDSGGGGYNGTAVNGATTGSGTPAISGTSGTCNYGSFNASTTYVKLPANLPHLSAAFTVTAWINATSAGYGRIFWDDYNYDGYAMSFGDPGGTRVRFYIRQPTQITTDSAVNLNLNQWYFIAISLNTSTGTAAIYVYNTSGTQLDAETSSIPGFNASTGAYATIGGNADGSVEGSEFRFPGYIDEVTTYNSALTASQIAGLVLATHPCPATVPDHFAVTTNGSAVNCDPAPVTIVAHTSAHAALATTDTIAITTSTGHGDWTLSTGSGSFVAGASNTGTATYKYAAADAGTVVLTLHDTYPETVTIGVADGSATATSGTATAAEDSPLTFSPSGFRFTNGANVATSIGTQVAGRTTTQSLALQAIRTDTNTGACTSLFASGTTANISLGYQCNNPITCVSGQSFTVTNNGTSTAIASNPATGVTSYTTVPLKFSTAYAEAPLALNYSDVGQVTLAARYNIPLGSGAASANNITGSGQFVVQPYTLTLSGIKRSSDSFANPTATTATGTVFLAAGAAFSATVTAVNTAGAATPNFGRETTPATVTLTPALVLPASGDDPAIAGSFGSFSAGVASGTGFSWPEVGIITITPSTPNYLATGTVTGSASGNVGRFIPATFATAVNTPLFATACPSGAFTYLGQPFTFNTAPVITVTPQAQGGTTTSNYTGSLFRLSNSSLTGRAYTPTPASPALVTSGLPATSADPAIADLGTGVGTLTFSAGSGLSFTRSTTPSAPFGANIALSINVVDLDGVSATNPVTLGSGTGIAFNYGANQYYGRLALRNALGSELLDLPMALTTQYYTGGTLGFTTNTADNCSAAPSVAFSNYLLNLKSGQTCVRDSGSPGASGAGCAAAAGASLAYKSVASAGNFNLVLAAPGSGNNGAVTVTASPPAWLQYLWNTGSGTAANPAGFATFGVYQGSASRIYQKEVY
jgi:MSHA biogenesis protein MshQ